MCGREITVENKAIGSTVSIGRLGTSLKKDGKVLNVELITGNGTWNDGIFCKYCIIEAFKKLDDRPKAMNDK